MDVERVLPPGSKEFGTFKESFARKLGDLEGASPLVVGGRQLGERDERQAMAVTFEKSDEVVVPRKSTKTRVTPVELLEGRTEAKGQSVAGNALPTQSGAGALTGLQRTRQRAKGKPEGRWTNLVSWVLDADIRSFFDTIDHGWMQKFVEHRIGDRRLVHLLMKWMKAGVMKDGELHEVKEGTPQGGIISPLLANIYLHYVLDLWVQSWRKKQAIGDVFVVRYADDFVMGFQKWRDARAMRRAVQSRLAEFGLELHPEKTRVLEFGRYARMNRERKGLCKPETFEFLGFLHMASKDQQGKFQLRRHTSAKKMRAKIARIKEECRKR